MSTETDEKRKLSVTFQPSPELLERLDREAQRRGLSRSDIVREALLTVYPAESN